MRRCCCCCWWWRHYFSSWPSSTWTTAAKWPHNLIATARTRRDGTKRTPMDLGWWVSRTEEGKTATYFFRSVGWDLVWEEAKQMGIEPSFDLNQAARYQALGCRPLSRLLRAVARTDDWPPLEPIDARLFFSPVAVRHLLPAHTHA